MTDENMNHERAKVFCEREIKVHVSKKDGIWYNGIITNIQPNFFFIIDEEDGRQLVFFKELKNDIREFTKKDED